MTEAHTGVTDVIADDYQTVKEVPARQPRTVGEVLLVLNTAAEEFGWFHTTEHEHARVTEHDDGSITGTISLTSTGRRAWNRAKVLIRMGMDAEVTGDNEAFYRAGRAVVHFKIEAPEDGPEDPAAEDAEPTPHADELVKQLVDRFNSHGMSSDHVEIHNDVCVTISFEGKTHRGTMKEREVGVFKEARDLDWFPQGIRWEDDEVVFRRDRD